MPILYASPALHLRAKLTKPAPGTGTRSRVRLPFLVEGTFATHSP